MDVLGEGVGETDDSGRGGVGRKDRQSFVGEGRNDNAITQTCVSKERETSVYPKTRTLTTL